MNNSEQLMIHCLDVPRPEALIQFLSMIWSIVLIPLSRRIGHGCNAYKVIDTLEIE